MPCFETFLPTIIMTARRLFQLQRCQDGSRNRGQGRLAAGRAGEVLAARPGCSRRGWAVSNGGPHVAGGWGGWWSATVWPSNPGKRVRNPKHATATNLPGPGKALGRPPSPSAPSMIDTHESAGLPTLTRYFTRPNPAARPFLFRFVSCTPFPFGPDALTVDCAGVSHIVFTHTYRAHAP